MHIDAIYNLLMYPYRPKKLVHRDYSTAAFRTAKEAFAFLQIQFWLHTDINSLMMQLYLEYGARVMEAEEQYRPGRVPGEIILEYLEDNVHYFNNVIVRKKNRKVARVKNAA